MKRFWLGLAATLTASAVGSSITRRGGGSGVTSVTASSPLASSGGTTPNITIQEASGSQSGFLSAGTQTIGGIKTFEGLVNAKNLDGAVTYTQAGVTVASSLITYGDGVRIAADQTDSLLIYAYKETPVGRVYSTSWNVVATANNSGDPYTITWSWNAVAGADGYYLTLNSPDLGLKFNDVGSSLEFFDYGDEWQDWDGIPPSPTTITDYPTSLKSYGPIEVLAGKTGVFGGKILNIGADGDSQKIFSYDKDAASFLLTNGLGNREALSANISADFVSTGDLNASGAVSAGSSMSTPFLSATEALIATLTGTTLNYGTGNITTLNSTTGNVTNLVSTAATVGGVVYTGSAITANSAFTVTNGNGFASTFEAGGGAGIAINGASGGTAGTLTLRGKTGGNSTGTGGLNNSGGGGGTVSVRSGDGGPASGSTATNTAGNAGSFFVTGGNGGVASGSSTTNQSGAGGAFLINAGSGGSSIGAGANNRGGAGGGVVFNAGNGGTAQSGTVTNVSGKGGDITFTAGDSGSASGTGASGGAGGIITFTGGSAQTGTNANGGGIFFVPGLANGSGTNGSVGLNVSSSGAKRGLTGIGTNLPTAQLHIENITASNRVLLVKGAASQSQNLQEWQDSASTILSSISKEGKQSFDATNTASGTTGNQTINKPSGTVNFAAGASSLTVTNSLVSTSSIVLCVVRTNDATAQIKNCVPASGSFTINLTAAATSETSVGFIVHN